MRVALLQMTSGDMPGENLPVTLGMMQDAKAGGAEFILTPEVTNCVSNSRSHQNEVLQHESEDQTLAAMRDQAAALGVWLLIGSLGLKTDDTDGRFANRSFMINPVGGIVARYDKIHMFDVNINELETFRESEGYRPGTTAVLTQTDFANVGMTICYDLRFPHLHRKLAHAGATILTAPAAFSPVSGAAHWHVLQRARAIETGCFLLAPAQCGSHSISKGAPRTTYGHSLVISPWGEVLADGGTEPGVVFADIDLGAVGAARGRIPTLSHDVKIAGPA